MDKSSYPNGRLLKLAINERQSLGMIPVNVVNSQGQAIEVKEFQQMLSPATPTVETLAVKSDFDKYGGTIAKATGKNLLLFEEGIETLNGITVEISNNQIKIDGTTNNTTWVKLTRGLELNISRQIEWTKQNILIENTGENYTLSLNKISGTSDGYALGFRNKTDEMILSVQSVNISKTEILNDKYYSYAYLYIPSGIAFDNLIITPQLELGIEPTPYVPWEGYHLDELCTIPAEDGTPISADRYGTLFAWVKDGE